MHLWILTHGLKLDKIMNNNKWLLYNAISGINKDFVSITSPLNILGVTHFSYYKVYKDGSAFYICTEPQWHLKHYQDENGFIGLKRTIDNVINNNIKQVVFSGDPVKTKNQFSHIYALKQPMNVEQMIEFNLWNSISYYKFNEHFFEAYNILGGNSKQMLGEFLLRNSDYVNKYISYFSIHMADIINKIEKKIWIKDNALSFLLTENNITSNYKIITPENKQLIITQKQNDILKMVSEGWPVKCIEDRLGISKNAINNYLNRLKIKTACTTQKELIKVWHETNHNIR